ncbi:hypothetical protein [Clavibacter capsici]|nr:hypothetical protein [Clavibacter capsici]
MTGGDAGLDAHLARWCLDPDGPVRRTPSSSGSGSGSGSGSAT